MKFAVKDDQTCLIICVTGVRYLLIAQDDLGIEYTVMN